MIAWDGSASKTASPSYKIKSGKMLVAKTE